MQSTSFQWLDSPDALKPYVEGFWLYDSWTSADRMEVRLPDGVVQVVLTLNENPLRVAEHSDSSSLGVYRGGTVGGICERATRIVRSNRERLVGIVFREGGAHPFLRIPLGELVDAHVSLEEIWGSSALVLQDKLVHAESATDLIETLESYLLSVADINAFAPPSIESAMRMLKDGTGRKIGNVAASLGLSARQLNYLFARHVGLSPKQYSRIMRFQSVLSSIDRYPGIGWSQLAVACGYYDQSHLVNDFRRIAGLTPVQLLNLRLGTDNHVLLPS